SSPAGTSSWRPRWSCFERVLDETGRRPLLNARLLESRAQDLFGLHAHVVGDDRALAIDHEQAWNPVHLVALPHRLILVEQGHGGVAVLLEIGARRGGGFTLVDREDHKALAAELSAQLVDVGHLHAARSAPGGPEVEQHDPSALALEAVGLAGQILEGEVG